MVLMLLTGCGAAQKAPGYRQVGMEEAMTMMKTELDYIILDVRRPDEFAEKHIPGAVNIPNETIGAEEIPRLPDKGQLILVYCRSGNRSNRPQKNWQRWDTPILWNLAASMTGPVRLWPAQSEAVRHFPGKTKGVAMHPLFLVGSHQTEFRFKLSNACTNTAARGREYPGEITARLSSEISCIK